MQKGKKSALHFHGSEVINYGRHFVLCSEKIVSEGVVEGLEIYIYIYIYINCNWVVTLWQ